MIKVKILIILLMFNLSLVSNLLAREEENTAIVMGGITSIDGNPIVKATVSIGDKFDFTDVNGRYRIEDVPFGRHPMKITKKGFILKEEEKVEVNLPLIKHDVRIDPINLLGAAFKDEDWLNRRTAIEVLEEIGEPALQQLGAALKDEDTINRRIAIEALEKIGKPALQQLGAALKDEDSINRRIAIEALEKIGKPALQQLGAALKDEDSINRMMAIEALQKITGKDFGRDQAKWQKWWEENKEKFP